MVLDRRFQTPCACTNPMGLERLGFPDSRLCLVWIIVTEISFGCKSRRLVWTVSRCYSSDEQNEAQIRNRIHKWGKSSRMQI